MITLQGAIEKSPIGKMNYWMADEALVERALIVMTLE